MLAFWPASVRSSVSFIFYFIYGSVASRSLYSFPTRRSSDLVTMQVEARSTSMTRTVDVAIATSTVLVIDRKSTRLNSSHLGISYAVSCLKKKSPDRRFEDEAHRARLALGGQLVVVRMERDRL